jgi:hypothetical protein
MLTATTGKRNGKRRLQITANEDLTPKRPCQTMRKLKDAATMPTVYPDRVALVTMTVSEGRPRANIREVHIMEPRCEPYRPDQIVRAARYSSHAALEPAKRTSPSITTSPCWPARIGRADHERVRRAVEKRKEVAKLRVLRDESGRLRIQPCRPVTRRPCHDQTSQASGCRSLPTATSARLMYARASRCLNCKHRHLPSLTALASETPNPLDDVRLVTVR